MFSVTPAGEVCGYIMSPHIDFKGNESACVHLTESGRVCVSEFCRRCWKVRREDEGEEWGLSKPWGRRRGRKEEWEGGRGGRDEWDHLIRKHTNNLTGL